MNYLSPGEYEAYGLEPETASAWVSAASALIDGYCRRPTLLVAQYSERLRLRPGRNAVRVSYLPLATVAPAATPFVSVRGRYTLPRRGEGGAAADFGTEVAQAFALPGSWSVIDPASLDYDLQTGEVGLPLNPLGLVFNELEVTYTAGLPSVPDAVKFAVAQIIRNAQATPALNVRRGSLDRMQMEYFSDSLLDSSIRTALAAYVVQKVG